MNLCSGEDVCIARAKERSASTWAVGVEDEGKRKEGGEWEGGRRGEERAGEGEEGGEWEGGGGRREERDVSVRVGLTTLHNSSICYTGWHIQAMSISYRRCNALGLLPPGQSLAPTLLAALVHLHCYVAVVILCQRLQ